MIFFDLIAVILVIVQVITDNSIALHLEEKTLRFLEEQLNQKIYVGLHIHKVAYVQLTLEFVESFLSEKQGSVSLAESTLVTETLNPCRAQQLCLTYLF